MIDLKELRRVASEARKGEWKEDCGVTYAWVTCNGERGVCENASIKDARHIAAFNPQTALALLDLIEKQEQVIEQLDYALINLRYGSGSRKHWCGKEDGHSFECVNAMKAINKTRPYEYQEFLTSLEQEKE